MDRQTLAMIARSTGKLVIQYVNGRLESVQRQFDQVVLRIDNLPRPEKGEPGQDGKPGANGGVGPEGKEGKPGEPGLRGEPGLNGKDGPEGKQGERGLDGKPGLDGQPGLEGKQGPPGLDGKPGLDGAPGGIGPQGERGEKGEHGDGGEAGLRGPDGEKGERGEKGNDGRDGRDGKDGTNGRDGAPGRDAFELDILPGIQEGRIVPRGTLAYDRGGIVRFTGTSWQVIVRGIAERSLSLSDKDPRAFIYREVLTDGEVLEQIFRIPAPMYLGVFRAATDYERGDMVTFDGSVWHCQAEKTRTSPGKSSEWVLAVKRGNDGKSGKDGRDGDIGPKGEPGQDLRYK